MTSDKLDILRGIATLICEIDSAAAATVERVTQQLRGLHQRGLLTPSAPGGPRGAWRFNLHEACRARLLLECIDFGMEGAAMGAVQAAFNEFDLRPKVSGYNPSSMLGAAIKDTAEGSAEWSLEVKLISLPGADGKEHRARLNCSADKPNPQAEESLELLAKVEGEKVHAVLTVPVSLCIGALIERFEA